MTLRSVWVGFVVLTTCAWACGGGSELDDYRDGVPGVVPGPVSSSSSDAGAGRDSGTNRDAGGGSTGGGSEGAVGAACEDNGDCEGDGVTCATEVSLFGLLSYELEGGYCTASGCTSDAQCPEGAGCFGLTGNCLKTCTTNSQCRGGDNYQCADLEGSGRLCVPGQAAADVALISQLAGGLLGGTGGAGGSGGLLAGLGGLLGGTGGAGGTSFLGGLFGGGGSGGPGGTGN